MMSPMVLMWFPFVAGALSTPPTDITELTDTNFGDFAKERNFLFVNFYAPWCSDSKALSPELDKLSLILGKRSSDMAKVDCFGEGKGLCYTYGVKHWPTLKTFRRGVITSEYLGAHRAEAMANYINGAEDIIQAEGSTEKSIAAVVPAPVQAPAMNPVLAPGAPAVAAPATPEKSKFEVGPGVETAETMYQIPSINEGGSMVSTSDEILPIKQPQNGIISTNQRTQNTARIVTPSAETINELECAKCRILTPDQRKQSPGCKSFKRECIPKFYKSQEYNVRMVPGGSGKKRRRRLAHFVGLR